MHPCSSILVVSSDQEARNRARAEGSAGSEASKAAKEGAGGQPDGMQALSSGET